MGNLAPTPHSCSDLQLINDLVKLWLPYAISLQCQTKTLAPNLLQCMGGCILNILVMPC